MNWSEVNSAAELLTWVPADYRLRSSIDGRPIYGRYYLTGFELTGRCWWCDSELTGRQRKYCRSKHHDEEGHWHIYYKHFSWTYARSWCNERQKGICANCGWRPARYDENEPNYTWYCLEVHHIIPLNGEERQLTPFNLPWNLIGFCHGCHLEIHAAMRPGPRPPPDPFELAIAKGQLVMTELRRL